MARKRIRLRTVGNVLTELGRQYRRADSGELSWQDAAAASRVLREMRQMIEGGEIERRLEALERRLEQPSGSPKGGNYHAARP